MTNPLDFSRVAKDLLDQALEDIRELLDLAPWFDEPVADELECVEKQLEQALANLKHLQLLRATCDFVVTTRPPT